ncbi:hypothetical protein BVC93_32210 (plasmid) [Mycobacterium sp. MS1601]|uniref:DUF4226 domain-containing protein n=1 Tax=Mycobacterium sp. MS1601 TaxID=1936029 RepID=UPI00097949B2|nr:DUF4226 domain-containing protein [Mycobacterium sp. MS1601]AQA07155.1 hypothetical protein BVC93_32210 [Mycobacterium sp. MS1601]
MAQVEAQSDDAWASASWGGRAAQSAATADRHLRQTRAAAAGPDDQRASVVHQVQMADADGRVRLTELHREIVAGVNSLQPSLDTPAERLQLIRFLESKAAETQLVQAANQRAAEHFAADADNLGVGYETLQAGRGTATTAFDERRRPDPGDDGDGTVTMANWGCAPLSLPNMPTVPTSPEPTPEPSLPIPLRDFTE